MKEPRWIARQVLLFGHAEALAEHGGREGIRDEGLLDSALARPKNLYHYDQVTDLFRLAACYASGLAQNHPFIDGNKRVEFLALGLFLELNGYELQADKAEAAQVIFELAGRKLAEHELADWVREHSKRIRKAR